MLAPKTTQTDGACLEFLGHVARLLHRRLLLKPFFLHALLFLLLGGGLAGGGIDSAQARAAQGLLGHPCGVVAWACEPADAQRSVRRA